MGIRRVRWWSVLTLGLALGAAPALASSKAGFASFAPGQIVRASVIPKLPEETGAKEPLLSQTDAAAFEAAYQAMNSGNWPRALSEANKLKNPIARKLVRWAYLSDEDTKPSFEEIVGFLEGNDHWPAQSSLLMKAEAALPDSMSANRVIAWFAGQEPLTGEGMVRLGEAMIETGQREYGTQWIVRAWSEHDFSDALQTKLFQTYRKELEGKPTADRLVRLLWTSQTGQAELLRSFVPKDLSQIAGVRIALIRGVKGAETQVLNLPKELREDLGITFDLARFHRRMGNDAAAQRLLIGASAKGPIPYADKWWLERNLQTRNALEEKRYEDAYRIVSGHGIETGSNFADAEWLAGWIALRFLDRPREAVAHFERLSTGVSYPISLARAHYWIGRAAEASGDRDKAMAAYKAATNYPYTFYGQLAAESKLISGLTLSLPETAAPDASAWPQFIDGELVKAIRLLNEIEGERYMRSLAFHIADTARSETELVFLSELMRQIEYPSISVRIAKKASQRQILLADYLYPLLGLPKYAGKGTPPEPALVLGLSRQESEFNPRAISSAGARGLMQLMPATARITANRHGLPYRAEALTSDPVYNMQIGMAHLGDLLERFDGSYILVTAAYNAGPGRVDEWLARNGDPRTAKIDAIDWIELIPFNETRNYVQRVLENTLVYRHRIAGEPVAFTMTQELKRTLATPLDLAYVNARERRAAEPKPEAGTAEVASNTQKSGAPSPADGPGAEETESAPPAAPTSKPEAKEPIGKPPATETPPPSPQSAAPPAAGPLPSPVTQAPGQMAPIPDEPGVTDGSDASTRAVADADAEDEEGRAAVRPKAPAPQVPTGEPEAALPSGAMKPGAEPPGTTQRTWKIPLDCQRFVVHADGTGECIE